MVEEREDFQYRIKKTTDKNDEAVYIYDDLDYGCIRYERSEGRFIYEEMIGYGRFAVG